MQQSGRHKSEQTGQGFQQTQDPDRALAQRLQRRRAPRPDDRRWGRNHRRLRLQQDPTQQLRGLCDRCDPSHPAQQSPAMAAVLLGDRGVADVFVQHVADHRLRNDTRLVVRPRWDSRGSPKKTSATVSAQKSPDRNVGNNNTPSPVAQRGIAQANSVEP